MIIDGHEKIILQLPLHSKDFHLVRCYYFFLLFYSLFAIIFADEFNCWMVLDPQSSSKESKLPSHAVYLCAGGHRSLQQAPLYNCRGRNISDWQRSNEGRCEQFWAEAIFVHELFYPWPNQKKKGEHCTMSALVEADMVQWMTSNFVKNTPLRVMFSSLFSVFEYPDEMLSLLFGITYFEYFLLLSPCVSFALLALIWTKTIQRILDIVKRSSQSLFVFHDNWGPPCE